MKKEISRRDFLKYAGVIAARVFFGGVDLNSSKMVIQPEREMRLAQIVRKGPSDKPWVALTFDDCWDLEGVKRILKVCEEYEDSPRITFFPVGQIVEKDPEIWRQVAAGGHEIGNHTYGHEYLDKEKLGKEGILGTIKKANEAIFQATGTTPRFFRPPGMYGFTKMNDYCNWLREIILKCNLPYVALWSMDSYTGAIKPGQENGENDLEIIERIISHCSEAKNGDIILMHLNKWDLGAIQQIITSLIRRGIKLVTLSELCGVVPFKNNQNKLPKRKYYRDYRELF